MRWPGVELPLGGESPSPPRWAVMLQDTQPQIYTARRGPVTTGGALPPITSPSGY